MTFNENVICEKEIRKKTLHIQTVTSVKFHFILSCTKGFRERTLSPVHCTKTDHSLSTQITYLESPLHPKKNGK